MASKLTVPLSKGGLIRIDVQFQGWDKLIAASTEVQTTFITSVLDPSFERNLPLYMVNRMHERQHRITSRMYNSTSYQKLSALSYNVYVRVPYARAENNRPGSKGGFGQHKYFEPSVSSTLNSGFPIFAKETMQGLLNIFSKVKP